MKQKKKEGIKAKEKKKVVQMLDVHRVSNGFLDKECFEIYLKNIEKQQK
jgi:hypothetical protein